MSARLTLKTVDTHAEGMPMRVLVEGAPTIPGDTMVERRAWAEANLDDMRGMLMNEPRGHAAMVGAILMPPARSDADFGVVYMSGGGFWPMCGHGTIGVATMLVERGLVRAKEPYTEIRLDTPAGLIVTKVCVQNGKALSVSFTNVPSFVIAREERVEVPGVGPILVDIAYGGNLYVLADMRQFGRKLELDDLEELTTLGLTTIAATREQVPLKKPWTPAIGPLRSILFIEEAADGSPAKNLMVKERRYFDRSPCGTGTSARMALAHSKGRLSLDEPLLCEALLGGQFEGRITALTEVGGVTAVIPQITGRAWITGTAEFVLDSTDVFPKGFVF